MAYTRLSAAEAAAMINDQDTIGLSGFTPNGVPKATFRELSKRAVAEHEAGRPFQVGILTGASTSQSIEGDMAAAHAIKFRAPFSTNKDFRTHTNLGEIDYEDMHLGHMAERLRRGFSWLPECLPYILSSSFSPFSLSRMYSSTASCARRRNSSSPARS